MQVAMQIALLERQTLPQLRGMWQKYFDTPPISQNKEFYISRLAYRIQELAYGGLSNHQQQLIANMYIPPEERNNLPPTGMTQNLFNGLPPRVVTYIKIHLRYIFSTGLFSYQEREDLLNQDQAKKIIDEMYKIVKNEWYATARHAGVTEADCEKIKSSFVYEGFNYKQNS